MSHNILPSMQGGQHFTLDARQHACLTEIANRTFTSAQEKEIQKLCKIYLVDRESEIRAIASNRVTEVHKKLTTEVSRLAKSIGKIENLWTAHQAVYFELEDQLTNWYPSTEYPLEEVQYGVNALHHAAVQAADRHKKEMCRPGRPQKNEAMRNLIWQLADLFGRAGGTPSAGYRYDIGKYDSPFLRWVIALNAYLPEVARVNAARLPELVHSVAKNRRKRQVMRQPEKTGGK